MKQLMIIIKEHIGHRKQIFRLARADLIKTYRGAALGWGWAVVKPAITILIYWFAFTVGFKMGGDISGFPFFLWLLVGIIPWFYMRDMLTQGARAIRRYSYLVTKMKFPVSIIPTFVSLSNIFIHIILMIIAVGIFALFGHPPTIYMLQVVFYMSLMFIFFTIWGLFASLLSAISKDFLNLVKSLVRALFWLSGILWNVNDITIPWLRKFLMLNPITFIVTGYRNCFIDNVWFWEQPKRLLYFLAAIIIMLILALWAHKKLRKEIADVL